MLRSALSKCPTYLTYFKSSAAFSSTQGKYQEQIRRASNPETLEDFWREQSKMIDWYKEPTIILDKSNPPFFRWFKDGIMNTSYNCLDRHVHKGAGSEVALIYESPVTNVSSTYTFGEMLDLVSRFANVLQKHGVGKGDKVLIYMPMVPEALVAMQACARIGAVHSVVFGGFSGPELASRIKDAQPKLIVSASCGVEPTRTVNYMPMIEEAVQIAGTPDIKRIIVQREVHKVELKKGLDYDFYDEMAKAKYAEPVPINATDYLYILYTSGTTGAPKGVVRDNGGNAVALSYCLKHVLDIGASDTYFCATDIGWVTGHSFVTYGPWLTGAKSILYEGKPIGTPDAGILWRLCEKHKVKGMFTSPTAIRSLRREDPEAHHVHKANLSELKTLLIAGERLDVPTYHWVHNNVPKSCLITDNYWQTETGWYISTNFKNLETFPNKPGCAGKPTPGMNVTILDEEGHPVPAGTTGAVCLKHPTPPSFASTIFNNDKEFVRKYMSQYPGYYFTGDAGYLDQDGFLHISSRLDDIINTAGHRLSTSQIEEVLIHHKDIVEAAVIGAKDEIKGEVPVGFVVLKAGVQRDHAELEKECIERVRHDIGPVASFKFCIAVEKLPKTRSGKIVRKLLRSLVNGEKPDIPATIEDASVVDAIKGDIERHGLGKKVQLDFGPEDTVFSNQNL